MDSQPVADLFDFSQCIICQKSNSETLQVIREEAYDSLFHAASLKSDDLSIALKSYLINRTNFFAKMPVYHAQCRRSYTRVAYKRKAECKDSDIRTRSTATLSKTVKKCFVCNKDRDIKGNRKLILVTTFTRQNEIWKKAKELNDVDILHRIQGFGDSCVDMIANDFKYHNLCVLNLLTNVKKEKDKIFLTFSDIFLKIIPDLEKLLLTDYCILTVAKIRNLLHKKAIEWNLSWCHNYPKSDDIVQKLKSQFKQKVLIVPRGGKLSDYVCSTTKVVELLEAFKLSNTSTSDSDELATQCSSPHKLQSNMYHFAKHLKEDIKSCTLAIDSIEISRECALKLIPNSIYNFFAWLLTEEEINFDEQGKIILMPKDILKVLNICQDVLFIAVGLKTPKHVGLAVYILKHTRSRKVVDIMSKFGDCVSYTEAQRFINDMAIIVDKETIEKGVFIPKNMKWGIFTQFAFDNLDFRECSPDGYTTHGTTHIIYQDSKDAPECTSIPLRHYNSLGVMEFSQKLEVTECVLTSKDKAKSRCLKNINFTEVLSSEANYDLSLIWNFVNWETENDFDSFTAINWSAFYETLNYSEKKKVKSSIGYGPFIPKSPTRVEVVEKSIEYCTKVARSLEQDHVIITVDQAIYEIIHGLKVKFPQKYKMIILRMGGFHICLNFLGAVGRIVAFSGIEDILVEAKILLRGTANKVISGGKDYYKMIRAHTLMHSAIFELYWEQYLDWLAGEDICDKNMELLLEEIESLKRHIKEQNHNLAAFAYTNISNLFISTEHLRKRFNKTFEDNPTALFWLQYINMICILQWYIMAERSGDWKQHLASVEKMLPFMVSAGHYKYISYIPHYLNEMKNLESTAPLVWKKFSQGKFNVHVTDGRFNGVWTDMALEQTYNKDAKNHLFQGITMLEHTIQKYLNALPFMSTISDNLENMFEKQMPGKVDEHHEPSSTALKNHINKLEIKRIVKRKINPFQSNCVDLINIYSGCKSESTDIYRTEEIGLAAIEKAHKQKQEKIQPVKLKFFVDQTKSKLTTVPISKLYEDEAKLFRNLHFTRELDEQTKIKVFSHEWTEYPPSLFEVQSDNYFVMRKGSKSEFYHGIVKQLGTIVTEFSCLPIENIETVCIIDIMALFQQFQSYNCSTFKDLFEKYFSLILSMRPEKCNFIVCVGDRYDFKNSIKSMERNRRIKGRENIVISYEIRDELVLPEWNKFVLSSNNKKNLLIYFSKKIEEHCQSIPENTQILLAGMSKNNSETIICSKANVAVIEELQFMEHEEADTRMFAIINYYKNLFSRVVIYSIDTDVLLLSMYYSINMGIEIWIQNKFVFIPCHLLIKSLANMYEENPSHLVNILLAIYCLSGCDSVSYPFRKGKRKVLKVALTRLSHLKDLALFGVRDENGSYEIQENVLKCCRYFFKCLYGRPGFTGNMDELRTHLFPFCKTDIRDLPPTENAFGFHVKRALLQCVIYKTAHQIKPDIPDILKCGWVRRNDDTILPQMTSVEPRPSFLKLGSICKCKLFICGTNCACTKANVQCSISCLCEGNCNL